MPQTDATSVINKTISRSTSLRTFSTTSCLSSIEDLDKFFDRYTIYASPSTSYQIVYSHDSSPTSREAMHMTSIYTAAALLQHLFLLFPLNLLSPSPLPSVRFHCPTQPHGHSALWHPTRDYSSDSRDRQRRRYSGDSREKHRIKMRIRHSRGLLPINRQNQFIIKKHHSAAAKVKLH